MLCLLQHWVLQLLQLPQRWVLLLLRRVQDLLLQLLLAAVSPLLRPPSPAGGLLCAALHHWTPPASYSLQFAVLEPLCLG